MARSKEDTRAWISLAVLTVVMAMLFFLPAGTILYWQAWVYLVVFMGASFGCTLYLMKHDPALLSRRMRGGPTAEKEKSQKIIMLFACIAFICLMVLPAFDRRFGWSDVPVSMVFLGDAMTAVGFYIVFLVYKENTFASATIEVVSDQKVITTGPYAIVRHPMYSGSLLYVLGTPLALGSYWGLVGFFIMLPVLIWRLYDEERILSRDLPGYVEYCEKVRWRLIPGVF